MIRLPTSLPAFCTGVVKTLAVMLASVAAALPPLAAAGPVRPNVLLIYTDDQRGDTIAAQGNPHIRTPHLDRLTREGVSFTRAYLMGAMQGAVCVPSRAMLMTGRTLFRVKENLAGQTTWPEQFGRAGYRTFISGKWHNQPEALLRSFSEGTAVFLGGMGDPYALPIQDISPEHTLVNPRVSGEHSVQVFADAVIRFLRQPHGDRPFLCYFAPNAPHDPRKAPASYHAPYNAQPPPLPPNFLPQHPFNNGALTTRDEQLAPWPRTPEVVRQHLADYYAFITFLDAQIGRVLAALDETGLRRNTLVVFSSDNGLAIGSHGLFGKQNLYDHSTHQPLIVAGPGLPGGVRRDGFCYLSDIYPTLGQLCGVSAPDGSEGLSLLPLIRDGSARLRDSVFTAFTKTQRAVRDDRWKLIVYPAINRTQLFDLQNDPTETKDLAADPARAAEVARLTKLLQNWQQQLDDRQALTTDNPEPAEFDFANIPKTEDKKRKAK
jgi:arylsulfatase A-like enzyme